MMRNKPKMETAFEGLFTWKIENFVESITYYNNMHFSETFFHEGYAWRIIIFRNRIHDDNVDYLSIYLDAADQHIDAIPDTWCANFKLALINQLSDKRSITKETKEDFEIQRNFYCGMQDVIPLDLLLDTNNGFLVNDTCIIKADITFVEESNDQSVTMEEDHSLIYLKGLEIEKAFVPLLEEVCAWHPSLLNCLKKRNRTQNFIEWAFTALGRVLHFLKTKKVKDMNDDACKHLQTLWEELETFGFDLTWLKPHFQYALESFELNQGYIKEAAKVKKLKEKVTAIDRNLTIVTRRYIQSVAEVRMLKNVIDVIAKDLKAVESNLAKEEEGLVYMDMELGYGGT